MNAKRIAKVENRIEEVWHESGRRGTGQSCYTYEAIGDDIVIDGDVQYTSFEWLASPHMARWMDAAPTETLIAAAMIAKDVMTGMNVPDDSSFNEMMYQKFETILF